MGAQPQQHGNKWRISVKDFDGKWKRLSADTAEEAQAKADAWNERLAGVGGESTQVLLDEYISRVLVKKESRTIANFLSNTKRLVALCPSVALIDADRILDCCKGLRSSSSMTRIKNIRWFVEYLEDIHGKQYQIDWKKLRKWVKSDDAKEKRWFDDGEMEVLWSYLRKHKMHREWAIFNLMSHYGIRVGAVTQLVWGDLNLKTLHLTLRKEICKNDKQITFPISKRDRTLMKHYGNPNRAVDQPIFINRSGEKWSANGLASKFRRICLKADLGQRNIHLLRSYAFWFLYRLSGYNLELVRMICGWDSDSYKYYIGEMREDKERIAQELDAFATSIAKGQLVDKPFGFFLPQERVWKRFPTYDVMGKWLVREGYLASPTAEAE